MNFVNFLLDHWRLFAYAALLLLSLILCLIRKKPIWNKMAEIWKQIFLVLPGYIVMAEDTGLKGEGKLNFVLNLVETYLIQEYGFNNFAEIKSLVIEAIEEILATPQRK